MATVPVQTLKDWTECELSGVHPRLVAPFVGPEDTDFGLASVELTPHDLSGNPYWRDIDAFGDPDGFPLELPARPAGRLVFASLEGEEQTCQNLTPFPNEAHGWTAFQPLIRGFPYRRNQRSSDAPFTRPGPFRVENVELEHAGFPGGDCALFRCLWVDDLLTEPDDGLEFSMTQGRGFAVAAERNLPKGVRVAYFLGYGDTPSERYANARELRVAPGGRREVVFTTYRDTGRRLPQKNETDIAPPREARRRRDWRFGFKKGGDVVAAEIRVLRSYVTLRGFGVTAASRPSDRFDTEPGRNKALWVDPPPRRRGADGWMLHLYIDNVPYVFHRLGDPSSATGFLPFGVGRVPVHIDAKTLAGAPGFEGTRRREVKEGRLSRWGLTQQDPPSESTESGSSATAGLEPLDGAAAGLRTFQVSEQTFAQNKTYVFRIADAAEDASGELLQGPPSKPVKHFVPAGYAPRVVFPDELNELENAEGGETRADGKPLAWAFAENNGTYGCERGVHEIKTTAPGASSPSFWQLKDVDQTRQTAYAGRFAAAMISGSADVALEEYGVPAADVRLAALGQSNPTAPLRTTVLASGSATETDFEKIFGNPSEAAPDATPYHQDTVSRRFAVRMTGATRNGSARLTHPIAGPDGVVPPKVEEGEPHEPASFDASPQKRPPRGPLAATGPAPVTGGEVSVEEPFETLTFGGAGEPQGWTKETSLATASVVTLADGSKAIRQQDASMSRAAFARYWRNVPEWTEGRGALRVVEDATDVPPRTVGAAVARGAIYDGAGNLMARPEVHAPSGTLYLRVRDRAGKDRYAATGVVVPDGAGLDWEAVATGGGTKDGAVVLLVGTDGNERRPVVTVRGVDWTGRAPGRAYFGTTAETNPQARWTFDTRMVQLSQSGAPIGEPAAGSVPRLPDRPTDGDGVPDEADPDGDPINRQVLWIPPGTAPFDTPVFFRMAVLPGETYALGVKGRHARYSDDFGAAFPWWVVVVAEDGRELVVGSLYGAGGAAGREGWSDRELSGSSAVTVPADFGASHLTIRHRGLAGGVYVFQGFCPSVGTAVRRGFGRETEGAFAALLDSRTPFGETAAGDPAYEPHHDVGLAEGWVGPRATADAPPGTTFAPFFGSSDSEEPTSFLPDVGSPDAVREATFARIGAGMGGDGRFGPEVPPGAVALDTRPFDSVLLRGDGTELDAGTVLSGVEEPSDPPDYETTLVDKSPESEPVTSRVFWLEEFTLQVFSGATKSELQSSWLDREWRVVALDHGEDGVVYQVKFSAPLSLKRAGAVHTEGGAVDGAVNGAGGDTGNGAGDGAPGSRRARYGLWTASVAGARILESWPLGEPGPGLPDAGTAGGE